MIGRRVARCCAAFVAAVVALGPVATPAHGAPAPRVAITLASQPATTPLGGDLPIDLRIDGGVVSRVRWASP